jgi:hypothetical protein
MRTDLELRPVLTLREVLPHHRDRAMAQKATCRSRRDFVFGVSRRLETGSVHQGGSTEKKWLLVRNYFV